MSRSAVVLVVLAVVAQAAYAMLIHSRKPREART